MGDVGLMGNAGAGKELSPALGGQRARAGDNHQQSEQGSHGA